MIWSRIVKRLAWNDDSLPRCLALSSFDAFQADQNHKMARNFRACHPGHVGPRCDAIFKKMHVGHPGMVSGATYICVCIYTYIDIQIYIYIYRIYIYIPCT